MRNILTILISLLSFVAVSAQTQQHSIIIDEASFVPESGLAIDKIGKDPSQRPCARIKMRINRMTSAEIDQLKVVTVGGNVVVIKQYVATEGNGLIIELTAKQPTRFYLHHDKYGDSNEVSLNLEGDKEYRLSAQLNILYPIVIATNVIDAEVYIDGIYQGCSDSGYTLTVNDITPGTHKLRVQSGSSIAEQNIEVSSTAIYFRLDVNVASSRPQYVVFSVTPKNAIVIVDNKNCVPDADGIVQLTLNNGSYNYHISANSYHDERGTFVVSGSKVEKNIELRPAHGWVEIGSSSHLKGASVYIDGDYIGQAPIKSDKLASGTYKVKIIKELYLPYEGEITIKDNETLKFNPSLTDNFAIVTITAGDGASIYVNNTYKGKSSWTGNLEAGAYIFEARKEGHRTTTMSRNITTQPQNQSITLDAPTPIIGSVDINSSPAIASVTIDGNNVGNTPLIQDLLIGEHTIVVNKQGYKSQTVKTTVKEGATEKLTITLQKETSENKSNTQRKYASASSQSSTSSGLGSIYITSVPVKAKVYIDSKYIGQTPVRYSINKGTHLVRVEQSGYDTVSKEVYITATDKVLVEQFILPVKKQSYLNSSYGSSNRSYGSNSSSYKKTNNDKGFNIGVSYAILADMSGNDDEDYYYDYDDEYTTSAPSPSVSFGLIWRLGRYNGLLNATTGLQFCSEGDNSYFTIPAIVNFNYSLLFVLDPPVIYFGMGTDITMGGSNGTMYPLIFQIGAGWRHHDINMICKTYLDTYCHYLGLRYTYFF